MKETVILFIFIMHSFISLSQTKESDLIVHSFSEIEQLQKINPKPIVIFTYTDWCKICFGMKKTTFTNKEILKTLNEKFYFVKLNAEKNKDIIFLGRKFKFISSGNKTGIHQLAKELASIKGKMSYPTTTILNSKFEIDIQLPGYVNAKKMMLILEKYLSIN
jgi:thioredoxin-related protein